MTITYNFLLWGDIVWSYCISKHCGLVLDAEKMLVEAVWKWVDTLSFFQCVV